MNVRIKAKNGKIVGTFDTIDHTYFIIRDWEEQVFNKRCQSIAISREILKRLMRIDCKRINCTITEAGKERVLTIPFIKFLTYSNKIHYEGKKNSDEQSEVDLKHWEEFKNDNY